EAGAVLLEHGHRGGVGPGGGGEGLGGGRAGGVGDAAQVAGDAGREDDGGEAGVVGDRAAAGQVAADGHRRGGVALGLVVERRVGDLHQVDLARAVAGVVAVELHDRGGIVDRVVAAAGVDGADGAGGAGVVAGADGGDVAVEVAPGVAEVGGQDLGLLASGEVARG